MDFALLPPEVISARMYTGPGAQPMLTVAATWDRLGEQLYSSSTAYSSVITQLISGPWLGPAATAMALAAEPYAVWLMTTADVAQQTACQARAAAAAFDTALAMTVPPSLISANRSLVMSLIESNTFGQNSPAIATAEAVYDRMWTQDVDAMYCYAGNSGAAARLSSFRSPPANTNLGSSAGQLSTAQQAAANNYAALTELTAALPGALQQLASPASSPPSYLSWLTSLASLMSPMVIPLYGLSSIMSTMSSLSSVIKSTGNTATTIDKGVSGLEAAAANGIAAATSPAASTSFAAGASAPVASVGASGTIGALSVPPSWATASHPGAAPSLGLKPFLAGRPYEAGAGQGAPALLAPPLAASGRRGESETTGATPRFDIRPTVMPRCPIGG
ncbi:hypothetical protein AWC27_19230 [Mycobacterium szulgai]|uniref:PPE family protein n=1 Tax=Mycobacterium szulgai TaxID=1787 RepID=A0A1X2FBI9_MYCSZ|nr:PPE domain-containing protein [Mycobacterium szulgai]ORX15811.1 hypothetical protein AWC27_19230 [Mycobacterium szulgai]